MESKRINNLEAMMIACGIILCGLILLAIGAVS
jgi:hypothetical protein